MAASVQLGLDIIQKMRKAGLIEGNVTRRCIIDIPYDGVVKVYIEKFADKDQFEVLCDIMGGGGYEIVQVEGSNAPR